MIDKNNEILLKGEIIELDNPEVSYKNYERVFWNKGGLPARTCKWRVIQDISEGNEDSKLPMKKLPWIKLRTAVRSTNATSLI